jgi:hypothetical protein
MFVVPFGHMSHAGRDAPDAAELAEEVILSMIERSKLCGVDTGDVASLLALELVASLTAYNRAPLPVILAAIAEAAPTREALARRQPAWRAAAAVECRQTDRDRSRCVPATLTLTGGVNTGQSELTGSRFALCQKPRLLRVSANSGASSGPEILEPCGCADQSERPPRLAQGRVE